MDAGEVTLVNHNSVFKTHLLSQTGFPEDQLSLSDHQVSNNFLSLINYFGLSFHLIEFKCHTQKHKNICKLFTISNASIWNSV